MVYLLHFDKPYKHAQHYIGYADDAKFAARIERHLKGRGSRLIEVIVGAGIGFVVACTWPGDRNFERRLKKRGGAKRICPICKGKDR